MHSRQQKISCKVRDEYSILQDVILPSEAASRLRSIPATKPVNTGSVCVCVNCVDVLCNTGPQVTMVTGRQAYPSGPGT